MSLHVIEYNKNITAYQNVIYDSLYLGENVNNIRNMRVS